VLWDSVLPVDAFVTMHSQRQALSIRRRVAASLYTGIAIVSLVLGFLLDAPWQPYGRAEKTHQTHS